MTFGRRLPNPAVAPAGPLSAVVLALPLLVSAALVLAATQLHGRYGVLVALAGVAAVGVYLGLRSPVLASIYLLVTTFFRLAIPPNTFPVDPFLPAFAGVVLSTLLWSRARTGRLSALNGLEIAIALYVAWNILSAVAPHTYAAGAPLDASSFSVPRFILIGVVMPLAMFLVGRRIYTDGRALRVLIWVLVAAGAYSALVSIVQVHGPTWLAWPPEIVLSQDWPDRASGVFNQPVVNGLVLIVGFLLATLVASHRSERHAARMLASAVAIVSVYGIYLTLTRAVWLAFVLVLIGGALFARGHRRWYVATLTLVILAIAVQWNAFVSSDRAAGGVGSESEIQDRLNILATSLWAVGEKPVFGWGIGRFAAVNTYHHQQWSPATPWDRGYGISSHLDLLGIMAELGVVGLSLWVTVLVLIARLLVRTYRTVPATGLTEKPLVLTAMLALVALLAAGLTVDLRFFDFPNIAVMVLVGAAVSRGRGDNSGSGGAEPPPVRARARPLTPATQHLTRKKEVLVLAPVLVLSLVLVATPSVVRVL